MNIGNTSPTHCFTHLGRQGLLQAGYRYNVDNLAVPPRRPWRTLANSHPIDLKVDRSVHLWPSLWRSDSGERRFRDGEGVAHHFEERNDAFLKPP